MRGLGGQRSNPTSETSIGTYAEFEVLVSLTELAELAQLAGSLGMGWSTRGPRHTLADAGLPRRLSLWRPRPVAAGGWRRGPGWLPGGSHFLPPPVDTTGRHATTPLSQPKTVLAEV